MEGIYDNLQRLPPGWQRVKIGDEIEVIRGASPRPKGDPRYFGGSIPWIMISDVTKENGKCISKTRDHVTEEGAGKSRYLKAGTLILSNSATVCVPKILGVDGCIHDGFVAFPNLPKRFDILYLYYFFEFIRSRVIDAHRQGITQVNLNTTIVKNIQVPMAPPNEQKRIVAEIEKQFSRLDEAVANLKRVKANLKRYKTAVLKAAVEGKLISTNKKQWEEKVLGDVLCLIQAGKSFKCEEHPPNEDEVGVVKVSAVTWGTYDELESKTCVDRSRIDRRFFIQSGDFLFSRANTIELVGACVIARKVNKQMMLSDKILRLRFTSAVLTEWVLYWLRAEIGRREIQRLSTGNQESMRNIGQERIRKIRIEVPPLDDQERIVAEVERRLSINEELTNDLAANLKRVERLRQSILQRAFGGNLLSTPSRDIEPEVTMLVP